MKSTVGCFALALVSLSGCQTSSAAQSLNSLRVITVERQTKLTLGAKMPDSVRFCDWTGETCALKLGTFGGAKGMSLTKTESGLIRQFHFDYGMVSKDEAEAQIEDYIRSLGKPTKNSATRVGGDELREIEWSDPATSFKLVCKSSSAQAETSATLFDKALTATAQ